MSGWFTVEGSDDFGRTWQEEITEPATDLRQATMLLRQDLDNTASSQMARTVLAGWEKGKGTVVVTDSGRPYTEDKHHWRYSFTEN